MTQALPPPEPEYPFTDLGHYLHELPMELRLERERLFRDNLARFEDRMVEIVEKTAKYLLAMNGGGIAMLSALIGAFYRDSGEATQLVPAAASFALGLIFCGIPLISAGRYVTNEYSALWSDTVLIFSSKIRLEHAGYRMVHRRSESSKGGSELPLFPMSFWSFIAGILFTLVGIVWPQWITLTGAKLSALVVAL